MRFRCILKNFKEIISRIQGLHRTCLITAVTYSYGADNRLPVGVCITMKYHDGVFQYPVNLMRCPGEKEHFDIDVLNTLNKCIQNLLPKVKSFQQFEFICFELAADELYSDRFSEVLLAIRASIPDCYRLVVNISEKTLPEYDDHIVDIIESLKDANIYFALGSFGRSSSSLLYVEHGGFQYLKISESLTLEHNGKLVCPGVIASLMYLSSKLGFEIIAEGINTGKQKELLMSQGIKIMQGSFFQHSIDESINTNKVEVNVR